MDWEELLALHAQGLLKSEYDDTSSGLMAALTQHGVITEERADELAHKVADYVDHIPQSEGDLDLLRKNLTLMDLVYTGLLFHEARDHFIRREDEHGSSTDGDVPDEV